MTIEAEVVRVLNPVLAKCLTQRTAAGVAKYGQRLEDNEQPVRAKAVHLVQELLDAAQYAAWLKCWAIVENLAVVANEVQTAYRLTAEEIMAGGKQ